MGKAYLFIKILRDLCQGLGCPKQTISSLIKTWEQVGDIRVGSAPGGSARYPRPKRAAPGQCRRLERLRQAEEAAFAAIGAEAREAFLKYNEALTQALERSMQQREREDERTH